MHQRQTALRLFMLAALTVAAQPQPSLAAKVEAQSRESFSASITALHVPAPRSDQHSYTDLEVDLSHEIDQKNSLSLKVPFTKLYSIPTGASEIEMGDLRFDYERKLGHWRDLKFKGRFRASAPTSRKSMDNGLMSRPQLKIGAKKDILGGQVEIGLASFYDYYLKIYKQTISGKPLPRSSLGAEISLDWKITEDLSLSGAVTLKKYWSEQSVNQVTPVGRQGGDYSFEAELAYDFNPHFALFAAFAQGDDFMKNGRYEVVFYDPGVSTYGLGLTVTF